jgi:hypothetical protein
MVLARVCVEKIVLHMFVAAAVFPVDEMRPANTFQSAEKNILRANNRRNRCALCDRLSRERKLFSSSARLFHEMHLRRLSETSRHEDAYLIFVAMTTVTPVLECRMSNVLVCAKTIAEGEITWWNAGRDTYVSAFFHRFVKYVREITA